MHHETRLRNSKILIVDDHVANVTLLQNVLNRLGYTNLQGLTDSRQVFTTVKTWDPDLLILDLAMPYMTGFEILEVLRMAEIRDDSLPVLVLTAEADPATKRKVLAAGANEFIAKPFDTSEIILRIRNLLMMRLLQQQLRDQNRILEDKVAARTKTLKERTSELEQAVSELKTTQHQLIQQERLRAFGAMAGGVAHDFNNVLFCVIGYTDLIINNPEILDNKETVLSFMSAMNTAGQDASRIVARLREFYRPRDESEILIPFDLNKLLEDVIPLTQPKWKAQAMAEGRDIDVRLDLTPTPQVSCHPAEIREVIINLLFNAVDAMPTGGTVTLLSRVVDDTVSLGVSDTGVGMSEEVRQRCMEPFFSTKGEKGTGLGLSMVFGIIKRHEGIVEIESEEGQGTTFWIRLPVRAGLSFFEVGEDVPISRPLHVLTVDDDNTARDVIARHLEADGHTVVQASSGFEAMEKFQTDNFELVITDHAMPGMTGVQLVKTIRSAAPDQPVILLTGYSDPAFIAAERPTVSTVSKSISGKELRRAVANAIAQQPSTDATAALTNPE